MAGPPQPTLVKAIGRWTLTALVLNGVIGSGIYGLPDDIARMVGADAPWVYLLAAAGVGVITAVFAEVGSQFSGAGGPYLYASTAFGRFTGLQMAWFILLVRVTSAAAIANLFVIYLGEFWPLATQPLPRALLLAAMLGALVLVNIRGVTGGARVSNFFTAVKIGSLLLFVAAGLWMMRDNLPAAPAASAIAGDWPAALLVLMFAYGGFETATIPMAEARNPRRDIPFALFTALATVAAIYVLVHVVAMHTAPDLASSERPLADAARAFVGPAGASLIAVAAMISTYGNLSAQAIAVPRLTYALAGRGDFPAKLAEIHPRFRTPWLSVAAWGAAVFALALYGSFIWNAALAAGARMFTYAVVCVALLRLRRLQPDADAYRLPAAPVWTCIGIAFCAVLAWRIPAEHLRIIGFVVVVGAVNWFVVRRLGSATIRR